MCKREENDKVIYWEITNKQIIVLKKISFGGLSNEFFIKIVKNHERYSKKL